MQDGLIRIGNTSVFIDGCNDHECNSKGHLVYELSDGFYGNIIEICFVYKINPNYCDKDIFDILFERDIHVTMCSVTCSICKQSAINKSLWTAI